MPARSLNYFLITLAALIWTTGVSVGNDTLTIEPEGLKEKLNQPGLTILDVRITPEWRRSDKKIPGAVREDPHNVSTWAEKYQKHNPMVAYCS